MKYQSGEELEQAELDRMWWEDHTLNYTGQLAIIIVVVAAIAVLFESFRNR